MRQVDLIFGPPGTGKTTELIRRVKEYLDKGVSPERIAFVSFSNRAIWEAAASLGQEANQFPHFRTIHSMAFAMLELTRKQVLLPGNDHWKEYLKESGNVFSRGEYDDFQFDGTIADQALGLWSLARASDVGLGDAWYNAGIPGLSWYPVDQIVLDYEAFKNKRGLWDFHDMIDKATGALDVDVLFVDEAQDTSSAQWRFLRTIAVNVPNIVIAGDDDQAIYEWSGADVAGMQRFTGTRTVLHQSYRLPITIKQFAGAISQKIRTRVAKDFTHRTGDPGLIYFKNDPATINLTGTDSWLLLARSRYQLDVYRDICRTQGVVYTLPNGQWSWTLPTVRAAVTYEALRKGQVVTRSDAKTMLEYMTVKSPSLGREVVWSDVFGEGLWDKTWMDALTLLPPGDREYIRALRRGGESLSKPGRVRIGTVHSAKGAEADNVVLQTDISRRVMEGSWVNPDAELRVQYVGVTRAKRELTILWPTSPYHWTF